MGHQHAFVDAIIVFVADREPDETDHEAKRSAIRTLEGVTYRADRQWLTSTDVGNTRISANRYSPLALPKKMRLFESSRNGA
jgi:hypothetical protein